VPPGKHAQDALLAVTNVADYARSAGAPLSVLTHTWSVAVEMQFYLLWPLVLSALLGRPRREAILVVALLYLAMTGWRCREFFALADGWDVYERADTHATGLVLGCLLGLVGRRVRSNIAILGLLILVLAVTRLQWREAATAVFGFTLAEAGAALVILARPVWLAAAPLVWVGRMSYGLYLWHYPAMRLLREAGAHWSVTLVLGGAFGLGAAALSHHYLERRVRSRSPDPRTVAAAGG
jgi:peptidoglycan/LPS O-acetylase OafA/YrhL